MLYEDLEEGQYFTVISGKDLIPWTIGAVFLPGLTLIYVAHVANRPSFDGIGKDKSEKNKDNG